MASRSAVLVVDDDAIVAARCRNGERGAFEELYGRHSGYVAGVVFRLMGDRAELADIVQETFLAALESIHRLRHPEYVRTWLVGIAVRRVRRRLHRRMRSTMLMRLFAAGAPESDDPEHGATVGELRQALAHIPPRFRIPWILHVVEGETLPDVARIEGVSLATVKRRIAAAEREVQRRLDDEA